ncbi:hypothetical protein LJR231_001978 [Phyllobacterium sp. LjRoot231]|uniref:hypothetical protein n=1 Tax=Phyllobacterium sp. LjRoot231 TaxID=3342289 RepID=UPI003ED12327
MRIDKSELTDAQPLSFDELKELLSEARWLGALWEEFDDTDFPLLSKEEEPET